MGDMGGIFNAMKGRNKERKENNLSNAQEFFDDAEWVKHTEYHWSRKLKDKQLDYWPSTNRWMWQKKKYTGKPDDLMNFIKKRKAR